MGLGVCVGLVIGYLGGVSIEVVRRLNSRATHAVVARLEAGGTRALGRLHLTGIGRDALPAALVTASGAVLAALTPRVPPGKAPLRGVAPLHSTAGRRGPLAPPRALP